MRGNYIFTNYIRQNRGYIHRIQHNTNLYSFQPLPLQYLHKNSFCNKSATSNTIKQVSLDDLLSSALMDDVPSTEPSKNQTKKTIDPIVLEENNENQYIDDDEEEELEDDDDDIDEIIDEIECNPSDSISVKSSDNALIDINSKYDNYLPAIPETVNHHTFRSMGLRKKLERNLCSQHGLCPLPIQSLAFDKIMDFQKEYAISGSIIESAMGTGKTLAYLLPIMNDLKPTQMGQIIIVVPTNELGIQIKGMVKSYLINHEDYKHNHQTSSYLSNNQDERNRSFKTKRNKIKGNKQYNLQHSVMNCNSNESLDYNIDYINKMHPSIIIGTAKRIRELFLYSIIKPSKINYIVFDEVDTLFPIKSKYGHKSKKLMKKNLNHSHLKPAELILNGIIKQQSNFDDDDHKCHALFVGATIPNQLKGYIHQILQPYPVQLISTYTHNDANPVSKLISPNITHQYIAVDKEEDKTYIISELINTIRSDPKKKKLYNPAVLIFLDKESSPIEFAELLSEYDIKCALMHEYINDKTLRSKFLKLFKNGTIDAVIATESICRGLDFIWLDHIIIAQIPYRDATYLHIAGRCSRLGSKGFVTSVVDEYDEERLKRHCFKYQIDLNQLDDKQKIHELSKQKRKYNKLNTFPLLLQSKEYQKKLKKQLYLTQNNERQNDDQCL